ncbi:[FeFe] hydrogenase H-cluster maturation GTPase HydF [Lacrimispora saccharolytica]|uniref:Small GTP-binding protein n=1 Tax=Lacrimispora saccharolytica (strain ATCC 35040 / DSM 2544 / NRCC 2533 / WM1) TaxID=610130 RepID=D9R497_LACSW|nr:[FeFe] hydrogenase H-cluster maturation GTPase HydF [Lacrimispora saccharolytica]ADL04967.1 small GTP-binding protein [[Clostridium] saccharolyticum WM1]QRV20829.1 [FeFe] hydrogenase H-cluster maturation GTPase HydF [Lacrimispora saccharolytica]
MGLNETPSSERVHIGFFGRRNAGKSSVVNAVTGQELSVVSEVKGTTTDPVYKSMELLPMGPVVIIDTPGFDDEGALGEMRVRKTKQILNRSDCAVLVVDGAAGKTKTDEELIHLFQEKKIPYVVAYNKCDLTGEQTYEDGLSVSASEGLFIQELKERIGGLVNTGDTKMRIVGDLLNPYDLVVLVIPIDKAAPKGRLILPQQQAIRDILEAGAVSVAVRETELKGTLERLGARPALVITDSQAFEQVSKDTPEEILLTSFSILMARYKGFLGDAVKGVAVIGDLKDGDKILISEGCTHHRQCDDIGTVKLPRWLRQHTGKELVIETSSGREFPEDLSDYKLIIHCGGCMLNEREMEYRRKCAADAGVPFTNYGTAIASMKGILKRSLKVFPHLKELLP